MSARSKRKKEIRKLQNRANQLWESQQHLAGEARDLAREASAQLGNYGRDEIAPAVRSGYDRYAAPYLRRGAAAGRSFLQDAVIPTAGSVVGSAMSVWDAATDARERIAAGKPLNAPDARTFAKRADRYAQQTTKRLNSRLAPAPAKRGMGAGGIVAIALGVITAAGIIYAGWQTLRADDELWVADDPVSAPDQ